MTDQERQQAFLKIIEEASRLYGIQLNAQIQSRTLGPIVQCEAIITLATVTDWQLPTLLNSENNDNKSIPSDTHQSI